MFWNARFQVVDVVAKLELAKANVGDVVQLQSPAAKILKRVYTRLSRNCLDPFNIDVLGCRCEINENGNSK